MVTWTDIIVLWYWAMVLWSCGQWCRRLRSDYPVLLTWTTTANTNITDDNGCNNYDADSENNDGGNHDGVCDCITMQ